MITQCLVRLHGGARKGFWRMARAEIDLFHQDPQPLQASHQRVHVRAVIKKAKVDLWCSFRIATGQPQRTT
jgi:hypothetical protein